MSLHEHIAGKFFNKAFAHLSAAEQQVINQFVQRRHTSRDIYREAEASATFGERVADRVASFGGSWPFIFLFMAVLVVWVLLNSYVLTQLGEAFDPYPYILLNLFLSMLAAVQAPVILMSQNRQVAKDRADQQHDYEVNLKTEIELMQLHDKADIFMQQHWLKLIELQQRQIELMQNVLDQIGKAERTPATEAGLG